jgi:HPt (histidine-containing phosphotransfer) domain-containing protein
MIHVSPAETALSEPQPVIDLDHLHSFTDGDPQLEGELLSLYLSTSDIYLAKMSAALAAGDAWSATAHALKGASANLGARRVTALALAAEQGPPNAAQLQELREAIGEVRALARTMPGWAAAQGGQDVDDRV